MTLDEGRSSGRDPKALATDDTGPVQAVEARHRLTVTVLGDLVDVLDALAVLCERPAAEVATELVLEGLRRAVSDPDVDELVRARHRRRLRLRVVR